MNFSPWTYVIFEPDSKKATVSVRLLAASRPSQATGNESVEALVEVEWHDDINEEMLRRNALVRLRDLLDAELSRFNN